ncbi:MAG: hypothetical protein ACREBJ_11560, partial [Nitrosotalea sp.]
MNSQGWVKLYRSTLKNDIFLFDPTAWRVFEVLLLSCDRKTGSWKGGREDLSLLCRTAGKSTTIYKATLRLEKAGMITKVSNSRFTTYYICNWELYQENGSQPSNSRVTAESHYNNNKEVRNSNTMSDCKAILTYYNEVFEQKLRPLTPRLAKIKSRLNTFSVDEIKKAIDNARLDEFFNGAN